MDGEHNACWHIQVDEGGRQRSLEITAPVVTLGRDRGNAVPIDSALVSGWHLELVVSPDGPAATDLGSRNGSALRRSGQRKARKLRARKPTVFSPDDELLLGAGKSPVCVRARLELVPRRKAPLDETIQAARAVTEVSPSHVAPAAWPLLLELNHQLLTATTEEAVLSAALASVLELVPQATHGTVAFFAGSRASRTHQIERVIQLERGAPATVEVSPAAISHTLVERVPLDRVVTDCVGLLWSNEASAPPASRTLYALDVRAAVIAPLWVGRDVMGVVQADVRGEQEDSELQPEHLDRLMTLAGPAALALRNAETIQRFRLQRDTLAVENTRLQLELAQGQGRQPLIIGESAAMTRLREMVSRVAPSDLPVLINGETGTGKELVARSVHSESERADGPFVACNVATLPPELVEAELFGAARGAYTGATEARAGLFEASNDGTLFLDELGELLPAVQAKLLRTLQDGEYRRLGETQTRRADVRVVAATNRNLEELAARGRFRQDLLFRVNTVTLEVPPLRERVDDIPLLTDHLLRRACLRLGRPIPELSEEVERLFSDHPWPGNVRQLENELARAVALTPTGESITADVLSPQQRKVTNEAALLGSLSRKLSLKEAVGAFEREYVRGVLAAHDGNRTHSAEALGITRAGLQKLIKRHGLQD